MLQVRYAKAPGVELVMAPAPHQLHTLMLTLGFSRDSLLPALNSSFRSWREAELASSMVWWGSGWKVSDKGRGCGFESRLQHQVEDAMGWYTALPVIIQQDALGSANGNRYIGVVQHMCSGADVLHPGSIPGWWGVLGNEQQHLDVSKAGFPASSVQFKHSYCVPEGTGNKEAVPGDEQKSSWAKLSFSWFAVFNTAVLSSHALCWHFCCPFRDIHQSRKCGHFFSPDSFSV